MNGLDAIEYAGNVINALAWAGVLAACVIALVLALRATVRARFTIKDLHHSSEDR